MENSNIISSYERYQTELAKFWSEINEVKNCLEYCSQEYILKRIIDIRNKMNNVSNLVPILEEGKRFRKENDGNINFREIFFLILSETKQKIGTAILDQQNIQFNYPNPSSK